MFLVLFIVLVLLRLFGKIESWWTVLGTMFLTFLFFLACTGSLALGIVIGSGKSHNAHGSTVIPSNNGRSVMSEGFARYADNHPYDRECMCEICRETRREEARAIKMGKVEENKSHRITGETKRYDALIRV